jgi:hypothetical protein
MAKLIFVLDSSSVHLITDETGKYYGAISYKKNSDSYIFEASNNFVASTTMMFQIANKLQELNSLTKFKETVNFPAFK